MIPSVSEASPAVPEAIVLFGRRSTLAMYAITIGFALAPWALAWMVSTELRDRVFTIGGLWVPFCFLVVPTLHTLCRLVVRQEARLEALERERGLRSPEIPHSL